MTRQFSEHARDNRSIQHVLGTLANSSTDHDSYKKAMVAMGGFLGEIIASNYANPDHELCLACTVEDADFLAKGMLDAIDQSRAFGSIRLACFWNERFTAFDVEQATAAPIKRRYLEPSAPTKQTLVIVKSIISGACVVKTNLKNLIKERVPERIVIAAPVILQGAEDRLKAEFSSDLSNRFEYVFFATDDQKDDAGNVVPGIGGNVYQRLGFRDQDDKNHYSPQIVKNRRKNFSAA